MNCGTANLCELDIIGNRYKVTWGKHISGLDVFSDKFTILFNMMTKDAQSFEIGLLLEKQILWISSQMLYTLTEDKLAEYVLQMCHSRSTMINPTIFGVIFDNMNDVNVFTDRLEKRYIWKELKR